MTNGLPWRRATRVAVAALVAALGLTVSGSAASTRPAGAQAPARSGSSSSLASGIATIQRTSADSAAAAAAQPPISEAGYDACANIATTRPLGMAGPLAASAHVTGWADAGKLGGSLPLGSPAAGLALSESGPQVPAEGLYNAGGVVGPDGAKYQCAEVLLQLDDAGQRELPAATGTFMEYGIVPVTATAFFVQDGPAPVKTAAYQLSINNAGTTVSGSTFTTIVTTAQVSLRVAQVKVNGVTLDVGGHCQTSGPVYTPDPVLDPGDNLLVLSGGNAPGEPEPTEQNVVQGGAQAGLATVPPFAGCVTPSGENLDALLDSSLSGPGNYVRVIQGPLCAEQSAQQQCTAPTAFDQPRYAPLWTVSHGGPYSSAAETVTISQQIFTTKLFTTTITCPGSAVSGDMPNAAGPPRGAFGTFRWAGTLQCTGVTTNPTTTSSWSITQEGTATLDANFYDPATQTTSGTLDNITLDFQGPGGCTAQVTGGAGAGTGAAEMSYSNATGSLTLKTAGGFTNVSPGGALRIVNSHCDLWPDASTNRLTIPPALSMSYPLGSGTVITSP